MCMHVRVIYTSVRTCVCTICTFSHYIIFSSRDVLVKVGFILYSSGFGVWHHWVKHTSAYCTTPPPFLSLLRTTWAQLQFAKSHTPWSLDVLTIRRGWLEFFTTTLPRQTPKSYIAQADSMCEFIYFSILLCALSSPFFPRELWQTSLAVLQAG